MHRLSERIRSIIQQNVLHYFHPLLCLIILLGFLFMALTNFSTYSRMMRDDIENISKLTSSNIFSEIDSEMTKPLYVSLTMANDSFLKDWLMGEKAHRGDAEYEKDLQDYLAQLQEKYQYNSVFLISAGTDLYYRHNGIHKQVSRQNAHDVWYYQLIGSGAPYLFEVDDDEADNHVLTVFVDCRMEDENGELLGVVGVGVRMDQLQGMLRYYEDSYALQAFLVGPDSTVQVHTQDALIESAQLTQLYPELEEISDILTPSAVPKIFWYPSGSGGSCLVVRYIQQLDWYLIVEKDTSPLVDSLLEQLAWNFIIVLILLALVLLASSYVIGRYRATMSELIRRQDSGNNAS